MRLLTREEKAVFDAIVAQRKSGKVIGDIFKYDFIAGQQFLHDSGASIKYGIDHGEQWNIISKLAKDGIIRIDLMNIYEGGKIAWVFGTDWAREYIQMSMSIEECYKKHSADLFININLREIKFISDNCRPAYKSELLFDEKDSLTLIVRCAGYDLRFKAFDDNGRPHKVFTYAYDNAGRLIESEEISKHVDGVSKNEYMASGVFLRNTTIKEKLSDYVYLKEPHAVRVDKSKELTLKQFQALKTSATSVTKTKNK